MKNGVKRTTVLMDTDTRALLDRLCKEEDRTLTSVVRLALIHFDEFRKERGISVQRAA